MPSELGLHDTPGLQSPQHLPWVLCMLQVAVVMVGVGVMAHGPLEAMRMLQQVDVVVVAIVVVHGHLGAMQNDHPGQQQTGRQIFIA